MLLCFVYILFVRLVEIMLIIKVTHFKHVSGSDTDEKEGWNNKDSVKENGKGGR